MNIWRAACLLMMVLAGALGCAHLGEESDLRPSPDPLADGGVIRGIVLRDGRPTQATVTGWIASDSPRHEREAVPGWRATYWFGCDPAPRARAVAGPDGTFLLRGLPQGTFRLEAVTPDGARGSAKARSDDDEPAEIHVRADASTLRGRAVLPSGAPWIGLLSVHDSDYPGDPPRPVVTDGDGQFLVEGLPRREVRLSAVDPPSRFVMGPSVVLPCEQEVLFTVGEGWTDERGTVVSDPGETPVPGALITASFGEDGDDGEAAAVTDSAGRFLLHVRADTGVVLDASAPGFARRRFNWAPGEPRDLQLRLSPAAGVEGRVVENATGEPVAAVTILYFPGRHGTDSFPYGEFRTDSGSDGRFQMTGLPPGRGTLLAVGAGKILKEAATRIGWDMEKSALELAPGSTVERDLSVVAAPQARGRVLDAAGVPVVGATIEAVKPGVYDSSAEALLWDSDPSEEEVTTDAEGTFLIPLLMPGLSYGFVVSVDGHRLASAGPFKAEAGTEMEVTLRVPPMRRAIVVVRGNPGGVPVAGAVVEARATLLPGETLDLHGKFTTRSDGTAVVGPLPAMPVQLVARRADGTCSSEEVEWPGGDGESVSIRMPDPAKTRGEVVVEGQVLLPDGSPAIGARLTLWSSPWGCMEFEFPRKPRTDFRGRFRLEAPRWSVNLQATLWKAGRRYSQLVSPEVGEEEKAIQGLVIRLQEGQ